MRFEKVRELPEGITAGQVEQAVRSFVEDSDQYLVPHDHDGLYHQTLENMASIMTNKGDDSHHFWLGWEGNEMVSYALCSISKDIDNRLCYWMSQAWVSPKYRRHPAVKQMYQRLRDEARRKLCKHIVIPSSRNTQAYLRFLGPEWHVYTTLLKQDLEN